MQQSTFRIRAQWCKTSRPPPELQLALQPFWPPLVAPTQKLVLHLGGTLIRHPEHTKSSPPPGVAISSGALRTPIAVPHLGFRKISGRLPIPSNFHKKNYTKKYKTSDFQTEILVITVINMTNGIREAVSHPKNRPTQAMSYTLKRSNCANTSDVMHATSL